MRLNKEFDTENIFITRNRISTEKLLERLKEHHDYTIPFRDVPKPQVIEIKTEPEAEVATPIEICVLPIETRITVNGIKRVVCKHFGVSHNDLISTRRDRKVYWPRMVAIYLSRELTPISLSELGRRFGGRDHSTIYNSIRQLNNIVATGNALANDVSQIREFLSA